MPGFGRWMEAMARRGIAPVFGLVTATAVSSTGDGFAAVAFPLLALSLTHDARLIAGAAAMTRLPWLLCSVPAGVIVDRCPVRRVIAVTESVRTILLFGLAIAIALHVLTLPLLYFVAFVVGTCETAFSGGVQATVPRVVEHEEWPRVNGYMYTAQAGGEFFFGPSLAGAAYAASPALPFLADGMSFALCGAVLWLALPRRLPVPERPASSTTMTGDARDGLRWFVRNPLLRNLALLIGAMALFQAMVNGVVVIYGTHDLHLTKPSFGLFVALGSVGNLIGGALASRAHHRWGTTKVLVGAGVIAASTYVVVAATASFVLAVAAFSLECGVVVMGNVASLSLRQALIPEELRGRVSNLFRMAVYGAIPLGALLGGVVAQAFGVRTAFTVAGVSQLVVVAAMAPRLAARIAAHEASRRADRTEAGAAAEVAGDVIKPAREVAPPRGVVIGAREPAFPDTAEPAAAW